MTLRSLLFALAVLLGTTGAALADPLSAIILGAISTELAASTLAVTLTTFAISAAAVGGGLFVRRRRP